MLPAIGDIEIAYCQCCVASFPPDEGQLGDICPVCNWECDNLEFNPSEEGIEAYSSANKTTLQLHRTIWYHGLSKKEQTAFLSRVAKRRQ